MEKVMTALDYARALAGASVAYRTAGVTLRERIRWRSVAQLHLNQWSLVEYIRATLYVCTRNAKAGFKLY